VVLANGLNIGLRHKLGLVREDISKCHSIMFGFDLVPVGRPAFDFQALTYYAESPADRTAYITLFPIGGVMRANLCIYREMDDPWLRQFREAPVETLNALMPNFAKIAGEFAIPGPIKIRPADLYVTRGYRQPGIVLVGDAFCTSCPAAGTGAGKVFVDVERLCNVYIPRWLASEGMDVDKVAAFYDDPVKQANDTYAAAKAYHLRSLSIEPGLPWQARRLARFMARLGVGMLRQVREAMSSKRPGETPPPARGDGLGKAA
jgi:2-polyprenyl-6-methoxyphenol hydroxylase-like FAD-dependent oxidoreductase